ncbi:L-type lectin-domain containing receptor kinase S.4-like [Alnus glutinosa]|uniref:L-type lectin-domain containing receptor kinase S.4-like n=1 Tax=Alnus glutinosa TaxID=3517 RepID=UPI002D766F6F|nr:L-type lectin-domain containing receptor kinase S.4-like [Alnus glutinosa]
MPEILISLWVFLLLLCPVKPQDDARPLLDEFSGGFSAAGNNLSLDGVAAVENNGVLRLTDYSSTIASGHAFYSHPIQFKNSSGEVMSFSTSFAFVIIPQPGKQGGDGLAFAISPVQGIPGGYPGSYIGLFNASNNGNFSNHILAVEFDTYMNTEYGETGYNHVAVDINSIISTKSVPVPFNLTSGQVIQAWIDYNSPTSQLNVRLATNSTKPSSILLSSTVNLSQILNESMYIGFSAATGLIASSHYILGWSFNMNGDAKSLNLDQLTKPQLPSTATGTKKNRTGLIVGVSVSGALAVILLAALTFYIMRRKKKADVVEDWEHDIGPHRFSYEELKKATRGFKEKELLGSGGFGRVYRGTLPNSDTQVAVKRVSPDSKQGLQEFVTEVASIGRLRHRNLVQLLGWCRRQGDLLLVYDFMPNGSLDKYLFNDQPKTILSWEQRFRIIKGVASGLLYLHEEWEQTVVHRDIKAANVLLDSEFNGRLSDFGLAKLYEHGSNANTTRVVGTLGYLAPELCRTGKPTTSSDVYAFGALLLEVVCGRRPVDPKASLENIILVDLVWEKWRVGEILDVVDQMLEGKFNQVEAVLVFKLGLMCSNDSPEARPTMRQVVRYLEGELELQEEVAVPYGKRSATAEDYVHFYPSTTTSYDPEAGLSLPFSTLSSKGEGR